MPAIGFDSIKSQTIFFTINNFSFLLTIHSYPMADIRLCYEKKTDFSRSYLCSSFSAKLSAIGLTTLAIAS
jgi:hypothetical protein